MRVYKTVLDVLTVVPFHKSDHKCLLEVVPYCKSGHTCVFIILMSIIAGLAESLISAATTDILILALIYVIIIGVLE